MRREELIKEYRVREILEATRRVIGHYGFQGTTIDRVAEEAGVAKGTIYLYFSCKDDLLHAAVLEGMRRMLAELRSGSDGAASPLERIESVVRRQFRILGSNQDFLKALILESSFVNFEIDDPRGQELRSVFADYLGFIASVLTEAMERGLIRRIDPQLGAFVLNELIIGSLRRRLLQLAYTPIEEDADVLLDLFLRGVQSQP